MRVERSDIKFPLWRKKVDVSLFNKLDTPIPNWVANLWCLEEIFGINTSRKDLQATVDIKIDRLTFKGWVTFAKYQKKDTTYKLFFSRELSEKLKDIFIMSYMRCLELNLRKAKQKKERDSLIEQDSEAGTQKNGSINSIENEIPFWEFLDIEFDKSKKTFFLKAHYFQRPIFPELFKQFVNSHFLKEIENKLASKGDFKFVKEDWRPRADLGTFLESSNVIYYLIDTKNKLLYIGEAGHTNRIKHERIYIPEWNYFRVDYLPIWLSKSQRVELERLIIRSYASLLQNNKQIVSMQISNFELVNKKIDL